MSKVPRITFKGGAGGEVSVDARAGETLLEIAEAHGVQMGSACGGVCGCSSCHCWILAGASSIAGPEEREEDRLDLAFDVRPNSRLGCQVEVGHEDLVVELTPESIETWYNEHPAERSR